MNQVATPEWDSFIGRSIGTVILTSMVGKGAVGAVFEAFQRTLKRRIAVKILSKSIDHNNEMSMRFRREGELVAVLSHPNIIGIYEMGEEPDCFYIFMQLIEGKDLEKTIRNRLQHPIPARRLIPLQHTVEMMKSILSGLQYAHEKGVIHQDIKPSNILIEQEIGRPLIVDFGIAKTVNEEIRRKGYVAGSPLYIAPEVIRGVPADRRSDIYSTGTMFFKMAAGNLPIDAKNYMDLLSKKAKAPETVFKKRPSEVSPLVDDLLEQIILKSIDPDPDKRFQNCKEFSEEIESYRRLRLSSGAQSLDEGVL